jgi:hypothetical protein
MLLIALTGLATLSRLWFTETETRLQIAAFLAFAVCVEWVLKPRIGIRPKWPLMIITGCFTTGAIILTRWHLKGLCPHTWPQCPEPLEALLALSGL